LRIIKRKVDNFSNVVWLASLKELSLGHDFELLLPRRKMIFKIEENLKIVVSQDGRTLRRK